MRLPVFRTLWFAALASNVGTWMHEVGAGWLMRELSAGDRVMVALVQAATTLPMFLLSLPAGALADVIDRRRLMIACQGASLALAAVLALTTWGHLTSPWLLVLVTLGLGTMAALSNPAWQTVMTDLVPREQLPQAAALNSVSLNLSRAIGPTLGGALVAAAGPGAAFALNAVSFVGITWALWRWDHRPAPRAALAERFLGAVRAGVRYVRHHPPMQGVLVRTASFTLPASCLWGLLPLLAGEHMRLSATGYGLMLGSLGLGAVTAGAVLPAVRARLGPNRLVIGATLLYAAACAAMALLPRPATAFAGMFAAGCAWLTVVTALNVSAQSGVPAWVRARALACYLSVFFGGMAVGSVAWGAVARHAGLAEALLISSGALVLGLATMWHRRLMVVPTEELARSAAWEDPVVAHDVRPGDGPVVVTIEYRIPAGDAEAFRAAMEPVAQTRYRDGAMTWLLTRDTEDPETWLEVFIVESWAEHVRQHHRVTLADERIQTASKRFHTGPGKPIVRHFIASHNRDEAGASTPLPPHSPGPPHDHGH